MDKREIVKKLVKEDLGDNTREELIDMLIDNPITVDIDKQEREALRFGDKVADKVSDLAGSWNFIIIFILFLILWIILNIFVLKSIDPYPFILLNLLLSCIAAIQAPIIMMSQHRAAKKDSIRNHNDYITDLKSELILEDLHRKLELVLENQKKLIDIIEKEAKFN
ncbi:MAG: DUF1003 domain-containing protein [Bacilli bacterium]|nr:DUF1003 domain-containing protein [Bacilli bacterium]